MIKTRQLTGYEDFDEVPGDWWWVTEGKDGARIGIVICLPNGELASLSMRGSQDDGRPSWVMTGDDETLSLQPSIHAAPGQGPPREWHGYLTNGQLIPVA